MARVKKQIAKTGHVVVVSKNGLNTSLRTNTFKIREAEKICTQITAREDQIASDKTHEFWKWNKADQSRYILYGLEPQLEEIQTLSVIEAIDAFLENRRSINKAFNTTQGYEFHLRRAKHYFKNQNLDDITAQKLQQFVN